MIAANKEARERARMREAQVGLPARRAAVEVLAAVLQKKQPLDDILGRSLERGFMFDLPARDRALTRAIVAASLRRKGQLDHALNTFLERGIPEKAGTLYPLLAKLRREELLDHEWVESEAGPPRKYYQLTEKGAAHLAELSDYWRRIDAALDELGR